MIFMSELQCRVWHEKGQRDAALPHRMIQMNAR